jgi:hypothetical protein
VNFDGTTATPCTIRGSGNVTSVTKNSTGVYTVNFTTAISDTNYAISISSNNNVSNIGVSNDNNYASARLVGSYKFAHQENNALVDASVLCVVIFR